MVLGILLVEPVCGIFRFLFVRLCNEKKKEPFRLGSCSSYQHSNDDMKFVVSTWQKIVI